MKNEIGSISLTLSMLTIRKFEKQLDDVMELTDSNELEKKLKEVEAQFQENKNALNSCRLGIIYHEIALNFSFLSKTTYKGYAKKSFDILSELFISADTPLDLMPFVASYRASALSLAGAESKKLKLLSDAFILFAQAVKLYAPVSYLPEFLRGSVAENLPWYFFSKRKVARNDFQAIINKQQLDPEYANPKIMSFTYWAWAKKHQAKRYRVQAINYLNKAIELDPTYKAGRKKAEDLKLEWLQ